MKYLTLADVFEGLHPHINVIVGENGVGKTRLLLDLVAHGLQQAQGKRQGFSHVYVPRPTDWWLEWKPAPPRETGTVADVGRALAIVLESEQWQALLWTSQEFSLCHPEKGRKRVQTLGAGLRRIVGITADIVLRFGLYWGKQRPVDALQVKGMVLIDDVDMNLHPRFQQHVLPGLQKAFPNIQFVVTTHSPLVISTAAVESVRLMQITGTGEREVTIPLFQTQGVDSGSVLAYIMGVDPIPHMEQSDWVSAYKAKVQDGTADSPEGEALWARLVAHYGKYHPVVRDCEVLQRFEKFKKKHPKKDHLKE